MWRVAFFVPFFSLLRLCCPRFDPSWLVGLLGFQDLKDENVMLLKAEAEAGVNWLNHQK
jgi:hypothetical protein